MNNENDTTTDAITTQRIIVIGASAGGFEALKTIVAALPPDLSASIFIVWHMAAHVDGFLPNVFKKLNSIPVEHAVDGETIQPNHIYVAPPDHHLLLADGLVHLTHGPKENRFRPAIDPLFRSAAYQYKSRVIGIILFGGLDDGTAGMWAVKEHGGTTIVQDPDDAQEPSMPASAMREVAIDHCVPASFIADLVTKLCKDPVNEIDMEIKNETTKLEIDIAAEKNALEKWAGIKGKISPFTCPECHGVLLRILDGKLIRYRCHTGHAYAADSLLAALSENVEGVLYNALRGLDETVLLLNHIGDHFAEANDLKAAAVYFKKGEDVMARSLVIRKAVFEHEQLSNDKLKKKP